MLGGATAEQDGHLVLQLLAGHQKAVFGRALDRIAERADAARNDRNLVHFVGAGQGQRDERVSHLVVRHDLPLMRVEQPVPFFETGDDPLHRRGEISKRHLLGAAPGREQSRLVDEVGEIGAGKAGGQRGDCFEIDIGRHTDLADMHLQDLHTPDFVRAIDKHLAVEAAGAQQGRIEDLGTVGRRQEDHADARIEAVELGEQLV